MKSRTTSTAPLLAALATLFAAAQTPACAGSSAPRGIAPISDYEMGLKRIEVDIEGVRASVILDTGAGITGIGTKLAEKIGCKPFGQLSGVRMTGEVLRAPWCGPALVRAGGVESRDTLMYFDIASLLPPDWPQVDGIVSLNAFSSGPITLDLGGNQLILESDASLAERVAGHDSSPLHLQRDVGGYSLSAFLEITAEPQPLRVLLDSGSAGGNALAPHAFAQLGLGVPELATETQGGEAVTVDLTVAGVVMEGVQVHAQDMIYDGNFGASFLSQNVVTLDFESGRIWVVPR